MDAPRHICLAAMHELLAAAKLCASVAQRLYKALVDGIQVIVLAIDQNIATAFFAVHALAADKAVPRKSFGGQRETPEKGVSALAENGKPRDGIDRRDVAAGARWEAVLGGGCRGRHWRKRVCSYDFKQLAEI